MGGDYFDESDAGDDLAEIWAQTVSGCLVRNAANCFRTR